MEKVIIKALEDLKTSFKKDELAYLALTSKVENPLRDRIAYNIFRQIGDDYLVCREWGGDSKKEHSRHATDLAILKKKESTPTVLIEFKAQSIPKFESNFSRFMGEDLFKLKIKAIDETQLYYIQFTNLPMGKIIYEEEICQSIKYYKQINRCIENIDNLKLEVENTWQKHLEVNKISDMPNDLITISAEEYYGHKISIMTHVLGPFFKKDLSHITKDLSHL